MQGREQEDRKHNKVTRQQHEQITRSRWKRREHKLYTDMRAIIYDQQTGITLFDEKLTRDERGEFETFLTEQGFRYEKQFDSWTNDERGYTAVIYPYA